MEPISFGKASASSSKAPRPFFSTRAARYSPFGVVVRSSASKSSVNFLGKGVSGGRRLPILVGDLQRRTDHTLFDIRLRFRNSVRQHGDPPRRGKGLYRRQGRARGIMRHQMLARQQIAKTPGQLVLCRVDHARRDLFRPYL